MTRVVCSEEMFREEAARHGADLFVIQGGGGTNVLPFARVIALKEGVPGALTTYENGGTDDAWLWGPPIYESVESDGISLLHLHAEILGDRPSWWDRMRAWEERHPVIVGGCIGLALAAFVGIVYVLGVGFSR